jgi:hypothetical protein
MNSVILAVMTLRSLGLMLSLQGNAKGGQTLGLMADALESGTNIDARMAEVAAALKSGEPLDWDALEAGIRADRGRLHGDG